MIDAGATAQATGFPLFEIPSEMSSEEQRG
jgi:hypothetical protein